MSRIADKVTQLCAWGTSRAVRIPKDMCERMGIDVGARLTMSLGHDERGSFVPRKPSIAPIEISPMFPWTSFLRDTRGTTNQGNAIGARTWAPR